ncbi:MAG: hypothetical protein KJ645_05670 [Planctomycetes bacterium]|nr:hypothetical protein [Planctomycetota bacterium]
MIEGTGLLFFRPWDLLRSFCAAEDDDREDFHTLEPPAWSARGNLHEEPRWWQPVFREYGRVPGFTFLGARHLESLSARKGVMLYDIEPDLPIRAGDPVVQGNTLIGFVDAFEPGAPLRIKTLRYDTDRSVVGEVQGTIAGTGVRFIAGGPSMEMEGLIQIRIPSNRFGLAEGGSAYTMEEPLTPGMPGGLFLGWVRLGKADPGDARDKVALQSPLDPSKLSRVSVMIPSSRLGEPPVRDQAWVFPLPFEEVPVGISRVSGPWGWGSAFRIHAGLETGIAPGNLVVSNHGALARLTKVGLFASSAELLVRPGQELILAVSNPQEGVIEFSARILRQENSGYLVSAADKPSFLKKGLPVYLAQFPCSGLERYPAFFVEDTGSEDRFTLALPPTHLFQQGFCLCFSRNRDEIDPNKERIGRNSATKGSEIIGS